MGFFSRKKTIEKPEEEKKEDNTNKENKENIEVEKNADTNVAKDNEEENEVQNSETEIEDENIFSDDTANDDEGKNVGDDNNEEKEDDIKIAGGVIEAKTTITEETIEEGKRADALLNNKVNAFGASKKQFFQPEQTQEQEVKMRTFLTRNQKKKNNILETLVEKGILTTDQVKVAETEASKSGDSIVDVLIKLNFVAESVIHGIFENKPENSGNKINLSEMIPDMELLKNIPISFAVEHKVIPISANEKEVKIATSNPYDIVLLDQISGMFGGREINAIPYSESEVISSVDKFYKGNVIANLSDILNEMEINIDKVKNEDTQQENTPVVKFVNALLYEAVRAGASDIHIEPDELFVRIRFRIDGVLMNKTIIHKVYWPGICVRVKVLSGMNIAESRKPQDGAMKMTLQGREIDFRVSAIPTLYGENIVIRVLDKTQGLMTLEQLGFNHTNMRLINLALQRPEGIIIVTGPTGSGKTTTLYSILAMMNKIEDNIMTLEEPVEYRLPMIRQSEINHRSGFDFATGLRSLLRQDPDIIFLGEIRDQETAEIAVRASITGHKVFSTLHTNSALSAITRLIDIGVQSYMLSDSLCCIVAQRLVRRLCDNCKRVQTMPKNMCDALYLPSGREYKMYIPVGCEQCYDIFKNPLDSLLKNMNGTNIHIGRGPNGVAPKLDISDELLKKKDDEKLAKEGKDTKEDKKAKLEKEMKQAISEERYEDAAKLRDQLKEVDG